MKKIRVNLKSISLSLVFLMILQGCSVYHSKIATVDQAVQSNNKVKVETSSNNNYIFNELIKEGDVVYGIAKKNSATAKLLSENIVDINYGKKHVKILLSEEYYNQIHTKNQTLSTVLSIGVPLLGLVGVIIIGKKSVDVNTPGWGS
ncbi:MAG: hypothetical protein ABFR05_11260 [Bacteroidota bacterium]